MCFQWGNQGAEGGYNPPHWHAEYGKYYVFSTFEPDFCTEMKNSPPIGISEISLRIFLFLYLVNH